MKRILRLLSATIILSTVATAQDAALSTITTTTGKTFRNVRILKVTPIDLRIIHDNGTASVALRDLEPGLQKRFGYNPAVLDDELKKRAEADQKAREYIAAEKKKIRDEEKALAHATATEDSIVSRGSTVKLKVSQVVSGGAICYGALVRAATFAERADKSSLSANGSYTETIQTRPIFVVGLAPEVVDGDIVTATLYLCGTYSYDTVGAGTKTVRKYATTAEAAEREMKRGN